MRHIEVNGQPLDVETATRLIPLPHGHFTAAQVRGNRIAGWQHHLRRLREASREMFGWAHEDEHVTRLVQAALAADGRGDASLRVIMATPKRDEPDVLVVVDDPVDMTPAPPLRTRTARYERELPWVKHLATMGLLRAHHQAHAAGVDDLIFVDHGGVVLEGSIWNLALWDGDGVTWPAGPVLDGVTQQLVRDNLDVPQRHRAVRVDELDGFRGAFFLNSQCACQPIGAIDAVEYAVPPDAVAAFERAWGRVSWAPLTAYLT
ncbi:aminotransferase class IV [Actinokineospora bangkokensis]|uniref:Class IV aminotransferase n=1 Tax=Actinokineospora bangkokensis TaxID=1193682 RepID=A0A1Q9LP47_9PSEU|nr:aminotransferase class IV [Actinokineospora bangkokensis]OLR93802.1 hypothetical protein BJP25_16325 [Actinokineospora bangkokensis]